jgi:4-hydroxybenzoate polyprenyltransferase
MNGHPAAFAAGFALLIGGIVSAIGDALGFVAVVTAACAGTARYSAVLLRRDQAQIERVTARGFFIGVLLSAALLVIERF